MLLSKSESVAWVIAVIGIAIMGFLAFHGPYNHINKIQASSLPPLHVQIVTNSKTIGAYQPASTTVHLGQKIIFTNVSTADHTVTASNNSFDSHNIGTGGQSWTYTPTKMGTYQYVCIYHPFMKGTLVVTR
jgi:plastocyanin